MNGEAGAVQPLKLKAINVFVFLLAWFAVWRDDSPPPSEI